MKLQTESSLIKNLQFVYCMEQKNGCIFDEETCKLSMRNYLKNTLKFEKVGDLYQAIKLPQNYIPNLKRLGIRFMVQRRQNIDNDNAYQMEENQDVNNSENPTVLALPPLQEINTNVYFGQIRGTNYWPPYPNPY